MKLQPTAGAKMAQTALTVWWLLASSTATTIPPPASAARTIATRSGRAGTSGVIRITSIPTIRARRSAALHSWRVLPARLRRLGARSPRARDAARGRQGRQPGLPSWAPGHRNARLPALRRPRRARRRPRAAGRSAWLPLLRAHRDGARLSVARRPDAPGARRGARRALPRLSQRLAREPPVAPSPDAERIRVLELGRQDVRRRVLEGDRAQEATDGRHPHRGVRRSRGGRIRPAVVHAMRDGDAGREAVEDQPPAALAERRRQQRDQVRVLGLRVDRARKLAVDEQQRVE